MGSGWFCASVVVAACAGQGASGEAPGVASPQHLISGEVERAGTRPVAIAAQDMGLGTLVTEDMVRLEQIPASSAPAGVVSDRNTVVGSLLAHPLYAGDWIPSGAIWDPMANGYATEAELIPRGMRAVLLPLKPSLHGGMVVDFWQDQNGRSCTVAQTVFIFSRPNAQGATPSAGVSALLTVQQIPAVLRAIEDPTFRVQIRKEDDFQINEGSACSSP